MLKLQETMDYNSRDSLSKRGKEERKLPKHIV